MREFESRYIEGFKKGLRAFAHNPRGEQSMVEYYNLKPIEQGTVPFEPLTQWRTPIYTSWPRQQLFFGQKYKIWCENNIVMVYDTADNLLFSIADTRGDWWDFADFGNFVLMVNGMGQYYIHDTYLGPGITSVGLNDMPILGTVCEFRGQLIGGKVRSSYYGCDYNSVIWSKIGSAYFTPDKENTSGYRRAPFIGQIHRVLPLRDYVLVYGSTGIFAMIPSGTTYGFKHIMHKGIPNKRAVEGDLIEHLFVDNSGDLFHIDQELKLTKLGYREFIGPMNLDNVVVSHDPWKREFYIADPDCRDIEYCSSGPRCYLFNGFGLSEVHQIVVDVAVQDGVSYGAFQDNGDWEWRFTTDTGDFKQRALKTLTCIELGGNYDLGEIDCRVGWADFYVRGRDTIAWRPWTELNPMGQYTPIVTASDFRISMRGDLYNNAELNLDYMILRLKYSDKRTIRGLYGQE